MRANRNCLQFYGFSFWRKNFMKDLNALWTIRCFLTWFWEVSFFTLKWWFLQRYINELSVSSTRNVTKMWVLYLINRYEVVKVTLRICECFILVLRLFQDYFAYIESIVNQRLAKTCVFGEKPPDPPLKNLASHLTLARLEPAVVRDLMFNSLRS